MLFPLISMFGQAPANDNCGSAEMLNFLVNGEGIPETTVTSIFDMSTASSITDSCSGNGLFNDVFYEFTMPFDGNVQFSGDLFVFDYLTVYTDCDIATEVVCRRNKGLLLGLIANTTYKLRHSNTNSTDPVTFTLELLETPTNDTCFMNMADEMIFVTNGDGNPEVTKTSIIPNASDSGINGTCDDNTTNLDVFYKFVMPLDGNVRFSGLFVFDKLTLYTGCDEATEVGCRTNNGLLYSLTSGTEYILRHSMAESQASTATFTMEVYSTILNDDCATAEEVVFLPDVDGNPSASFVLKQRNATPSAISNTCDQNTINVDQWYEFTMPVQGNISVSGLFVFDRMALYSACDAATEIDCFSNNGIFENLTVGETYLLRNSIAESQATTRTFAMTALEVIVNDECEFRTPLNVTTTEELTVTTDLRAATASADPNLPNPCGENPAHIYVDVWYEFTMPVNGNLAITNSDGPSEAIVLYDMCGDLVDLGCEFGSGIIYNLTGNTIYILRYADRDVNLNSNSDFRLQAFETLPNDECEDRIALEIPTETELTVVSELRGATASTDLNLANPCEANVLHTYVDAWYEFEMPVNGNLVITNSDSNSEALTLFSMCGDIVELHCEFGSGVFYNLSMGSSYIMRYSDRDINVNGNSDFRLQAIEALSNDECENRETLVITTTEQLSVETDLRGATPSIDPNLANPCEANALHTYVDAWYEFVMPVNGNVQITNTNSNTEAITLYNACGENVNVGCEFGSGLLYDLNQGTTYLLRYSDRDVSLNSNSDFKLQAFEKSENDECADASVLNLSTLNPVLVSTDFRSASNDSEISCENNTTRLYLDIWYDLTMPVDGEIQLNNVSNNMYIAFFDECGGNEISCFFNDGSLFNVSAGTQLKMRASVRDISAAQFTFDVAVVPSPLSTCGGTTEFIAGEWNNGIPNNSMNAIIRENYNTSTTINPITLEPYGSLEACSVSVDTGRTLIIAPDTFLEVTGDILVNGTLEIAHTANVVQLDPLATTTNNGTINVNITTPLLAPRDFMLLGSPMTNEMTNSVFAEAHQIREHNTSLFVPNEDVAAEFPFAENFADDNGDDWTMQTGLLNAGQGYFVQPQPDLLTGGSYELVFNDEILNNGTILMPLIFNTDKNSSPNILANPYPSAILADDFINNNITVDEVYFWEHITEPSGDFPGYNTANFSMEDISMYNLMGGVKAASDPSVDDTKPNGIISTGQGFGVKANIAGVAIFSNEMRRLTGNTTLRTNQNETEKLWLSITAQEFNRKGSSLLGFSNQTSQGLDAGFDSNRLASILSIFSGIEGSDVELGIQSREAFTENISIPIGYSTMIDMPTLYSISVDEIEGAQLFDTAIILEIVATGERINISENAYEFISEKGQFKNAFILHFKNNVLDVPSEIFSNTTILPNPSNGVFKITTQEVLDSILVTDILGRQIYNIENIKSDSYSLDLKDESSGVYFVILTAQQQSKVIKIIKE